MAAEITLQGLSPVSARLCLATQVFIRKELGLELAGCRVQVALSGGADSTALLLILHVLAPRLGFRLCAAHLDHALRPESAKEASQAGALCAHLGIPFVCVRKDVAALARQWNCGTEEAARRARYEFLLAQSADWTALGHHAGDLAEDMLLRLTRGAMWPALGGMDGADPSRRIFRPLLLRQKAELVRLLQELGIAWAEDGSNADLAYKRNRMRHQVLPLLLEENPSFADVACKLWLSAWRERQWLRQRLPQAEDGEFLLSRDFLKSMSPALRLQAFAEALRRVGGHALHQNLLNLEAAFAGGRNGKVVQFCGATVRVGREGVLFLACAAKD